MSKIKEVLIAANEVFIQQDLKREFCLECQRLLGLNPSGKPIIDIQGHPGSFTRLTEIPPTCEGKGEGCVARRLLQSPEI